MKKFILCALLIQPIYLSAISSEDINDFDAYFASLTNQKEIRRILRRIPTICKQQCCVAVECFIVSFTVTAVIALKIYERLYTT